MDAMLYLCATPIGNMGDLTPRAVSALSEANAVYAEDTRRTGLLLARLSLKKPLVSCHAHNEAGRAAEIVERVRAGEAVVYVSDAGMPGISDPGERLVRAAIEANIPYTVLPGACAATMALVLSGLPAAEFCFIGFLPREGKPRRETLSRYVACPATMVLYESKNRVAATLLELKERWGERDACLARELTKVHEEVLRGTLSDLHTRCLAEPPRGECVLVVSGAKGEAAGEEQVKAAVMRYLDAGLSPSDAAKRAAADTGTAKNAAYQIALSLKKKAP